jgi:sugar transferase (PEP-CTERM/EpsH1 system associated)
MRILCLTPRLPYPPDRGDRLRAFHFVEHLSREHELILVSFVATESQRQYIEPLRAYCRDVRVLTMTPRRSALSVAWNLWRRDPLQVLYYRSPAMTRLVDEVLSSMRFDAAYVHLFRMAPYLADHLGVYRIVDLTDVISREVSRSMPYRGPAARFLYGFERPRIERYERWVAETFEETWLISQADRSVLARACPGTNIQVVRNGVDLEALHPTGQPVEPDSLIFVGHLRVFHNIDAATYLVHEVMPLLRRHVPGCTLKIVGANPAARVLRLADEPSVTVTGFVPDLNDHLNRAAVFVAPLRFAAGVQNKVLEAMAAARPVVTTSLINEGLGAQPDRELLIADDAGSTAERIAALLRDEGLRDRIGRAGREFVRRTYSWDRVLERVRVIEQHLATR